jgi:anthranilate synthase component 1
MYLLRLQSAAGDRFDIVGSSPEALVTVYDGKVTTHPIAGTRWRGATEEEDELLEKDLRVRGHIGSPRDVLSFVIRRQDGL